jgi:CDP-diacylglycerol--serine O-phosphatidyltransferase
MSMDYKRFFRYLAPNLVTLGSLLFGMLSIKGTIDGHYGTAAWFILFSVLTDKLDGTVARLVKGTSELGVQLDSFADFLNFGVAPAALWYSFFTQADGLPYQTGEGRLLMLLVCGLWMLAVTFRLARFNIVADDPKTRNIFFGVPTTLAGGCLVSMFMAFLKYGDAQYAVQAAWTFDEPRLFGQATHVARAAWLAFPGLIVVGAVLMASSVRIPKLGKSRSKALTVFIFVNVFIGYVVGFMRVMSEYVAVLSAIWIVTSVVHGTLSARLRALKPPPLFPRTDPPPGKEPHRPEDDVEPDEHPEAPASAGGGERAA